MSRLTVIIPARDEECGILAVVEGVRAALVDAGVPFRLILVDDGSRDRTVEIMETLRAGDPEGIEIVRNRSPLGLGGAYKSGLARVRTAFVAWIPADGEIRPDSFRIAASDLREDTIVVPYPSGARRVRSAGRAALSVAYQRALNMLFLNRIRYFNGNAIYPTAFVRAVEIRSNGHFFNAELLLRVIGKFKPRIRQVPFELAPRARGASKAINLSNLVDVGLSLTRVRVALWRRNVAG